MPRTVTALKSGDITDWSGRILPKEIVSHLDIGCVVRVALASEAGSEALYMKILKKKNGARLSRRIAWMTLSVSQTARFSPSGRMQ